MATEESRPAIPAELRRQVLVEAGHRCAIHTCRHPAVDIHHIEPWVTCREHRFENLIALCPNCHRRADAGEIDRKSLSMYKARLAAAFRFEEYQVYPDEEPNLPSFGWLDSQMRWRTLTERDSDVQRRFEAQLEYPDFRVYGKNLDALNDFVREKIRGILKKFRDDVVYGVYADDSPSTIGYEINSSFAIALLQSNLVSIRFTVHAYAGGAHGSTWTEPVNAFLNPFRPFGLSEIFPDLSVGVAALASYCINFVLHPKTPGYSRDEEWVKSGAAPKPSNFSKFNLTEQGLLVTFDEYQIDCYAAGRSEVLVPYSVFGDNLDSRIRSELSIR